MKIKPIKALQSPRWHHQIVCLFHLSQSSKYKHIQLNLAYWTKIKKSKHSNFTHWNNKFTYCFNNYYKIFCKLSVVHICIWKFTSSPVFWVNTAITVSPMRLKDFSPIVCRHKCWCDWAVTQVMPCIPVIVWWNNTSNNFKLFDHYHGRSASDATLNVLAQL